MKYAIIAAGEGSRLAQEGIEQPKPLVKIGGECLVNRLLRIFMENKAEEILVICNDRTRLVSEHLDDIRRKGLDGIQIPLKVVVKSTPSSMHSFFELSSHLEGSPFILTTVDTIFNEKEFTQYMSAFLRVVNKGGDGLMGVTSFIDDEKPLYVATDEALNITGFYDESRSDCRYISGGIYGLTPIALGTLRSCIARGESRMRNFQRALVADGCRLRAYPLTKVLDIDHASDIQKAENFLHEQCLGR